MKSILLNYSGSHPRERPAGSAHVIQGLEGELYRWQREAHLTLIQNRDRLLPLAKLGADEAVALAGRVQDRLELVGSLREGSRNFC